MTSNVRWAALYLVGLVAASSVAVTFEWAAPIETPEGDADWWGEAGLRDGSFVLAGHEPPGGGWVTELHWPRVVPFPLWAGAGPESGGLYVSVWFGLGSIASLHWLLRARRQAKVSARAESDAS